MTNIASRNVLTALCIALTTQHAVAQQQQKLNIDQATVYLSGAELVSGAKVNLQRGENEVVFTNVAGDVNTQSITVNAGSSVVVESVTFQNNFLAAEVLSPKAKAIKDSIQAATEAKGAIANKIAAIDEQIAIMQGNRKVGGDNTGLNVAELTKMLDLVGARLESALNSKSKQEEAQKKIDERITKLQWQLNEEQKKEYQPGGQLLVKFFAKEAATVPVAINYVVPHAGWSPTYDIMADDVKSPVKLYYKANIHQNCGVNWSNVRLRLSTGNPDEGVQAPALNPWYLSFYEPRMMMRAYKAAPKAAYDTLEIADPVTGSELTKVVAHDEATIDEHVTVDNGGVNTSFDIDLPYTIPTDGKEYLVAVKKYDVPASYRYFAAPKLDNDAFLQADITQWEDLNLLPGPTNIFYEGAYVGQGTVDVRNLKDTMTISLGRDKKVVVKRERDVKLRSAKTIGTNVKETFAFTITVRNTRKEPINITLHDQQPVTTEKDIVVEDKETGDADYNEQTGLMKWTMQLNANETKKTGFGYTIKYPKGKTVANMR